MRAETTFTLEAFIGVARVDERTLNQGSAAPLNRSLASPGAGTQRYVTPVTAIRIERTYNGTVTCGRMPVEAKLEL
jgi:hypothetical protein